MSQPVRSRGRWVLVLATALLLVPTGLSAGPERPVGDTKIWVRIPDPPGNPEGIAVERGMVFVGTHTALAGDDGDGPSEIHRFHLRTRNKAGPPIKISGQVMGDTHGILGMAFDALGRLYVLDRSPPRLLRLTGVFTGRLRQETYATFPDLAPCRSSPPPCSPTAIDSVPFPDYLAFDKSGNVYVTDLEQGVIFVVPRGGGKARIWFADERLDSVFGPNGIAVDRFGTKLYLAMTTSLQPGDATRGVIFTLPVVKQPKRDDLKVFFVYPEPATGPDGMAFGKSGRLYVALAGSNQLSILTPEGAESARFPSAADNQLQTPPYDLPASISFDGRGSLLLTNQSFFADNADNMVVFDVWTGDVALPLVRPTV